jgi:hyaluronate lyase
MKTSIPRSGSQLVRPSSFSRFVFKSLAVISAALLLQTSALQADEFDDLRLKWKGLITGGASYNPLDSDIALRLDDIEGDAQSLLNGFVWDDGNTSDGVDNRLGLWPELQQTTSTAITQGYRQLRSMALAYTTHGSSLNGNTTLRNAILNGLDWMHAKRYTTAATGSWWDLQIGAPIALIDTMVLMYPELTTTSTQKITNYCAVITHHLPTPHTQPEITGANLVWKAEIVILRSILLKDGPSVISARNALSPVFDYSNGDGFHVDGSFLQHTGVPYNGGYGKIMLLDLAKVIYLLQDSGTYAITDSDKNNIFNWVYDSFYPLMHKGAFMSMVRGREISRQWAQDHYTGHDVMESLLLWPFIAPQGSSFAEDLKGMIKYWATAGEAQLEFLPRIRDMKQLVLAKELMDGASAPMAEPVFNKPFPDMDRVVHFRPGFAFGLSMHSKRTRTYESSHENKEGWYTGYGMTYLYNDDLDHYDEDYWPTVDTTRLPGVTAEVGFAFTAGLGGNDQGTQAWVGASVINDASDVPSYGAAGMSLDSLYTSLVGKKSWFMFDDEIVALGAGITRTDTTGTVQIKTIVENRKLNATGSNEFKVNNLLQSATLPWSANLWTESNTTTKNWAHLVNTSSPVDKVGIGYFFPAATAVSTPASVIQGTRTTRTGLWKDLNTGEDGSNVKTHRYLTLEINHGANPTNARYAYALLPGKTAAQTSTYAANPHFTILENSAEAQAVKENNLNITAANIWKDGSATSPASVKTVGIITSNKPASVLVKESATEIIVAVSDPTQESTTIELEIARAAGAILSQDMRITVTQLSPTIKLTVNVATSTLNAGNDSRGRTWSIRFGLPQQKIVDNAGSTGVQFTGAWQLSSVTPGAHNISYHHDSNSDKGSKSVRFTPVLTAAGPYNVYGRWTSDPNRAASVPFKITKAGTTSWTTSVNQQTNGGQWNLLGSYSLLSGTESNVTISNSVGVPGFVIADAVMFEGPFNPAPAVVILDNASSTGITTSGLWPTSPGSTWGAYNTTYCHDQASKGTERTFTFAPSLSTAGTYKVYARWSAKSEPPAAMDRADNVPYTITHANGTTPAIPVNQQINPGEWVLLGTYSFSAGTGGKVKISNSGTAAGTYVIADAVMFVKQ